MSFLTFFFGLLNICRILSELSLLWNKGSTGCFSPIFYGYNSDVRSHMSSVWSIAESRHCRSSSSCGIPYKNTEIVMLVSITAVEQIQRWGPVDPFPKANADCKNLYHFGWRPRIFVLVSSKEKEWSQTRKVLIKQMRMTSSWKKVSQPSFRPCHTSCPLRKKSQNNIPEMLKKLLRLMNFPNKSDEILKLKLKSEDMKDVSGGYVGTHLEPHYEGLQQPRPSRSYAQGL